MDMETAEAVDVLRTDIHRVEKTLAGKMASVESSLTARIENVEREVVRVETALGAKIEHVETSLAAKMDEQKRHTDVRIESMHDDIRLLAENLASLGVQMISLRR